MIEPVPFIPPRIGPPNRTPNDSIIVSCGIGRHYRERLRSTINHCEVHCPDAWKLWYDELPENCPTHEEHHYYFKITALQRAVDAGFRYILWMDTGFQPVASIEPLWQKIAEDGWYVPAQGHSKLGTWSSDTALDRFGMSRDAAMQVPLVFSGLVGLDIESSIGLLVWKEWNRLIHSFNGPHYNEPGLDPPRRNGYKWHGHCSHDPRCEGHRHDESALSFALHHLGLTPAADTFLSIGNPETAIIGHLVPDYDVVAMRMYCMQLSRLRHELFGNPPEAETIRKVCR